MNTNIEKLVFLGVVTAALHWLFARAKITEWFWSRMKGWPAKLLACPACSGFWLGLGAGALGLTPVTTSYRWIDVALSGVLCLWATPIFEGLMLYGLAYSAIEDVSPPHQPLPDPDSRSQAPLED